MLHFAYGSNMSRTLMAARCPGAVALGTAVLADWRFVICRAGYASIEPSAGTRVHGVLWRIDIRDLAAIDAYESLDSGLYVRRSLPVRRAGKLNPAFVYIAGCRGEGIAKPAYIHLVIEAAQDWGLPARYIGSLRRRSASGWRGARGKETGEIA
jgi:gamma-glutamylcyclotransferase (GGCT)/AIG2-like uncharacterized protein YtfP